MFVGNVYFKVSQKQFVKTAVKSFYSKDKQISCSQTQSRSVSSILTYFISFNGNYSIQKLSCRSTIL